MTWTRIQSWTAVAWCILATTGCTVCQDAMRTIRHEPAAYSWKHDRRRSIEVYRQWADQALSEEAYACPQLLSEPYYAMGFRDGFVDFVYAGGTGEPPPVPPRQFWNVMLRVPEGKQRASQWFDGYRHGSAVARDGGYRDLGTVQSSLFAVASRLEYSAYGAAAIEMEALETEAVETESAVPEAETLPEPGEEPLIPTPFDAADPRAQDSLREPASESTPANKQIVGEEPLFDDPPPPTVDGDDQSMRIEESPPQMQHDDSAETDDATMSLREVDPRTSDVQPAILLRLTCENDRQHQTDATKESKVSTVRFVSEPGVVEANSNLHHLERMPQQQWQAPIGAHNVEQNVNHHGIPARSHRVPVEAMFER